MTTSSSLTLAPGATLGILGGGQLGRMLSLAASRLGFQCHIFDPKRKNPASDVSAKLTCAEYSDLAAVVAFAKACDVVTYEFENVPAETAKSALSMAPLFPGPQALETAQDRLIEKRFIRDKAGVPVTDFHAVETADDIARALKACGGKGVLKTRRMGYDGKGQALLKSEADIAPAFEKLGAHALILEAFVPFKREVSVVAARNTHGKTVSYPLIENVHKNHILHTSIAPASGDDGRAQTLAVKILSALDYVGVMAVEFFELEDGTLIVNEIAPRVHNSGHWTQDAGCIDQFELHIRAICGWPLGDTSPKYVMEMTNLLGNDIHDWESFAKTKDTFIHLYGKDTPRDGRKMGHINRVKSRLADT